jgi:pantoate--beta-alanine ligase
MRLIHSPATMQRQTLRWKRDGVRVALIPTMGCLHEGHLSLVRQGRRLVGRSGIVVVSIYVNPAQFGPQEDWSRYPRDLPRDRALCHGAGVDVVFAPTDAQMYPGKGEGRYSTYVIEERLSCSMEGESRPTHFRGVTTVVAKLFNLVQPDVAVFGAKDWQQAAVIKRMVADLNLPVKVVIAPTVREADGLALSSRNKYLSEEERRQATVLWQAIQQARRAVRQSKAPLPATGLRRRLAQRIERQPAARVDYLEFFHPDTLEPMRKVRRGHHLALAVFIGRTRLIDNGRM